ncbi:unnamed protein product [Schistosoma curassoni]|uniref:Uncharacterized protein n=1 Tax=Schistosoma curassoni TaxID=6186 RepID=A0A183KQ35_9TREM|nr:unnamed protein product [Schistosoma curassoni]
MCTQCGFSINPGIFFLNLFTRLQQTNFVFIHG